LSHSGTRMARYCMRRAGIVTPLQKQRFPHSRDTHENQGNSNYQRNLMGLTGVPTMTVVWVTKLFSSVPMKKPFAR
jgi:hypothetical protein